MFVLDDIFVKPLFYLLEVLHDMAIEERYDTEEIRDRIKENRLLYELGERSEEEYARRKRELTEELEVAEEARERLSGKVEVMG